MAGIGDSSRLFDCIVSIMRKTGIVAAFSAWLGLILLDMPAGAAAYGSRIEVRAGEAAGVELIVFEAPGCRYCLVFRRDVAPSYAATPAGRAAPLRFVDLNGPVAERFELAAPVTVVPTFVLARDGAEMGRIAGYVGREGLHRLLAGAIPRE